MLTRRFPFLLCVTFAVSVGAADAESDADGDAGKVSVEVAVSEAEQIFKGRTIATQDTKGVAADGAVIEYFAPSGEVYRWYPGHPDVLKGTWTIDGQVLWLTKKSETRPPLKLCRNYAATSGPGYPRSRLRARDCDIWALIRDRVVASSDGDVFRLGRMKSPCRMCTPDRAVEKLKAAASR